VVARAGRREQHDVSRLSLGGGELDCAAERLGTFVRTPGRIERRRELVRRLTDEVDRDDVGREIAREGREVLSFATSSENQPNRLAVRRNAAPCCSRVRRLRVV